MISSTGTVIGCAPPASDSRIAKHLGHKAGHVTTHYSAPEIGALIAASEKVCELGARKTHAMTVVGSRAKQQVLDFTGGERGTRTLDLGIMSATL